MGAAPEARGRLSLTPRAAADTGGGMAVPAAGGGRRRRRRYRRSRRAAGAVVRAGCVRAAGEQQAEPEQAGDGPAPYQGLGHGLTGNRAGGAIPFRTLSSDPRALLRVSPNMASPSGACGGGPGPGLALGLARAAAWALAQVAGSGLAWDCRW
jgi:hypothetical protein